MEIAEDCVAVHLHYAHIIVAVFAAKEILQTSLKGAVAPGYSGNFVGKFIDRHVVGIL